MTQEETVEALVTTINQAIEAVEARPGQPRSRFVTEEKHGLWHVATAWRDAAGNMALDTYTYRYGVLLSTTCHVVVDTPDWAEQTATQMHQESDVWRQAKTINDVLEAWCQTRDDPGPRETEGTIVIWDEVEARHALVTLTLQADLDAIQVTVQPEFGQASSTRIYGATVRGLSTTIAYLLRLPMDALLDGPGAWPRTLRDLAQQWCEEQGGCPRGQVPLHTDRPPTTVSIHRCRDDATVYLYYGGSKWVKIPDNATFEEVWPLILEEAESMGWDAQGVGGAA